MIRESAGFVTSDGYRYYVTKGGKIMTGSKPLRCPERPIKLTATESWAPVCSNTARWLISMRTKTAWYAPRPDLLAGTGTVNYITKNAGRLECGRTFKVKGKTYKAYSTGKLGTGVFKYGTTARFYADKYGVVKTTAGFVECLGNRYYVQKGGKIELGHTFTVKGRKYKAFADGRLGTGIFKYGSKYYYADSDGAIASKAGVVSFKKKYYYVNKNGSVAMNG